MRDAIAGIHSLIEDAVTAIATTKGQNGVRRTDNWLQAMLKSLVNKTLDEKLYFVNFENCLLRRIEEVIASCLQVKKMTEEVLHNQNFIAPVAAIVREETKKSMDVELEREDRRQ